MPEGSSVRSPGSWQGGSWVSALLVDVFCWTPSRDLALLSFCLLSWCFCARSANSEALDAIAFWSRHAMFPFAFCFCLVLFGVWVVGVCFLLCLCWFFVLELAPLCSDFAPLLNPQRGIQWMHLRNSFISTTRCDDLARATEAQDGKKKCFWFLLPGSGSGCPFFGFGLGFSVALVFGLSSSGLCTGHHFWPLVIARTWSSHLGVSFLCPN